jgi:hypothetical protein
MNVDVVGIEDPLQVFSRYVIVVALGVCHLNGAHP